MEKDYLISAIVPVYNTYEYVNKCLHSVCIQSSNEIQVVIVDDGSSDGGEKICDTYAKRYENVCVIHKNNQGLVAARKKGVEIAKGEYITFIDSDDWIDDDWLIKAKNYIKDFSVDIILFDCIKEYRNKSIRWRNCIKPGLYNGNELKKIKENSIFFCDEFVPWSVLPHLWNKLIRKDLIKKYIDNVSDNITFGEDATCFYPCLWNSNQILVLDEAPYHYLQREESMSNHFTTIDTQVIQEIKTALSKSAYMNIRIREQIFLYENYLYLLRNYAHLEKYGMTLYPFDQIKKNDKIIIYGAGGFGKSLFDYINKTECVRLQAIVDRLGEECSTEEYQVVGGESIYHLDFDYIVIAILNEKIAKAIAADLIEKGIERNKVLYITREELLTREGEV